MALWILAILIAMIMIVYRKQIEFWLKIVYIASRLSGPKSYPLIGSILLIEDKSMEEIANVGYEKYGSIMPFWLFIVPTMVTFDPKVMQIILSSSKHAEKSFLYKFMHTLLGKGLITNNGINVNQILQLKDIISIFAGLKWKFHRKLIQPYFRKNILRQYVRSFYETSRRTFAKKSINGEINVTKLVNKNVLNLINECILGISKDDFTKFRELQVSPFASTPLFVLYRLFRPWYLFNSFYNNSRMAKAESKQKCTLEEYARKVFKLRKDNRLTGINCKCLMDMLIEISNENEEFTDSDVIDEICTFMLAGQESVASAIAFALYYLAKNADVQTEARREIDGVLLEGDEIDVDALEKLVYLEQCVKETLRLAPSVPLIARTLTEDVTIGKFRYPKGTIFFLSPFATHRLRHVYDDPLKFDPERFSSENERKLPQFAYIPFSAGPRNCIGHKFALYQIKTVLALILRNYELSTSWNLRFRYGITLRSKNGITIDMRPRNQNCC